MILQEGNKYRHNLRSVNDKREDDKVYSYRPYMHTAAGSHARTSSGVKTKDSYGNPRDQKERDKNIEKLVDELYENLTKKSKSIAIENNDVIIPAYNSAGKAEYTKIISDKLAAKLLENNNIKVRVIDCLSINPREQQRLITQKEGTSTKVGDVDDVIIDETELSTIDPSARIWIFDNVANKGKTYNNIVLALREKNITQIICPLVYTLSIYSKIEFNEDLNAFLVDRRDPVPLRKNTFIVAKDSKGEYSVFVDCEVPDDEEHHYGANDQADEDEEDDFESNEDDEDSGVSEKSKSNSICLRPEFKNRWTYRVDLKYTKSYLGKIYIQDIRAYRFGYEASYMDKDCVKYLDGSSARDLPGCKSRFDLYFKKNNFKEYNSYTPEIERIKVARADMLNRKQNLQLLKSSESTALPKIKNTAISMFESLSDLDKFELYKCLNTDKAYFPAAFEKREQLILSSVAGSLISLGILPKTFDVGQILDYYKDAVRDSLREYVSTKVEEYGPDAYKKFKDARNRERYLQQKRDHEAYLYKKERELRVLLTDTNEFQTKFRNEDGSFITKEEFKSDIISMFGQEVYNKCASEIDLAYDTMTLRINTIERMEKEAQAKKDEEAKKAAKDAKQAHIDYINKLNLISMDEAKEEIRKRAPEYDEEIASDEKELMAIVNDFQKIVKRRIQLLFNSISMGFGPYVGLKLPYRLNLSRNYEYPLVRPGILLDALERLTKYEKTFMSKAQSKTELGCDFYSYYWALLTLVDEFGHTELTE